MQFALAVGATVMATTSTETKAERQLPWRSLSHKLSRRPKGLTLASQVSISWWNVGAASTQSYSLRAIRTGRLVAFAGILDKSRDASLPSVVHCTVRACTARGLLLKTLYRVQEKNQFIEEKEVQPIVGDRVFEFAGMKMAYERLEQQRHFAKVCIRLQWIAGAFGVP
ncbi:zinc-binding alcohol dehydrogenase-like protein [Penicillium canariense]|uniref:Zinc-binding alcohol dehydrogenase-like protein n=1 Tax=Penicillium canariense TaxID=189055 RepID=A0A9W9LEL4_9EURO|nr:zinc-binding alcohol dehydrogenase-like protein [Penicillium canariense]KAJ5151280.1 zinc-binding alcohol dehydrogenase-like protein [Penicillium canariense]